MLSIVLLAVYIYIGLHHFGNIFTYNFLQITGYVSLMTIAMAVGLFYMRAESTGSSGLFAMAGKIEAASSEQSHVFSQKFRAARESLYTAGIFFWLVLALLLHSEGVLRVGMVPLHYNMTFFLSIPVIVTLLLDTLLRICLKISARFSARLKLDGDLWLIWLGLTVLGFIVATWIFPYSEDDSCVFIVFSPLAAALLTAVARYVFRAGSVSAEGRSSS
ncbi:MAG: hypothetical protein KKB51_00555 [Candidatus Riflebacteria bacterium]|nr:hypothetical protein [Candidatus Riflebacteria bacterium]